MYLVVAKINNRYSDFVSSSCSAVGQFVSHGGIQVATHSVSVPTSTTTRTHAGCTNAAKVQNFITQY